MYIAKQRVGQSQEHLNGMPEMTAAFEHPSFSIPEVRYPHPQEDPRYVS